MTVWWINLTEIQVRQNWSDISGLASTRRTVKGINLITLYYTDISGNSYPVNFRLYDKQENKTKNDYFIEMLQEIRSWGIEPDWVTGDSWYSSMANLKFLRNEEVGFLFGVADNRKVSLERGQEIQVQRLVIPESGLVVYLKEFGWVKVFSQDFKNEPGITSCGDPN